jgi:hypothetical protein
MMKNDIYPPMFWSGTSYECKITTLDFHQYSAIDVCEKDLVEKKLKVKLGEKKDEEITKLELVVQNSIQRKTKELKDFTSFIVALSVEAESIFERTPPVGERPLELWESFAVCKDLESAILHYVTTRKRVLIPEVISALSVFCQPIGNEVIQTGESRGENKRRPFYWNHVSKQFKEAVKKLVADSKIKWIPAEQCEYVAIRNIPTFDKKGMDAAWKAAALAPA